MNRYYFSSFVIIALTCLVLLTSCSDTTTINLKMSTAADVNPNRQGEPSPLVVTLYQLKDDETFKLSDLYALYYRPQQILGKSLLGIKQFELTPDTVNTSSWNISKKTKYLGLVAAYRNMDAATWQLVIPTPKSFLGIKTPRIYFRFNRYAIKQIH